jgi:inosose dehydratase
MSNPIATAPCSYGVFEITVDRPGLPDGAELARVMAASGYVGTELGPPGYFGTGPAVGQLLASHGLELMGSFLPLRFSRADGFVEDLAAMDAALDTLEAAGGSSLPMVLLADAFIEPDRMKFAGAIEEHPETWLPDDRFELLITNLELAAARCRERGFPVSLHYHAGTYVETPREIDLVVEAVDTSALGLCFDTGHSAFGGGDPLEFLRKHGDLVNHVHFKDVDLTALKRVQDSGGDLVAAWEQGVFCPLGTGDADVSKCLDELERRGYDGWIVVEQDRVLGPDESFDDAAADGVSNRKFLAERGL